MKKNILLALLLLYYSCEVVNIDYLKPIMITHEPYGVRTNSAILGGYVLGEGGKDVTEYGIVWSETFPPTIDANRFIEGERVGYFSKRYENLEPNTTYYYSSYGINETGVGYGQIYEFKTNPEPTCSYTTNNFINLGENSININDVIYETPTGFNDGNIQFETRTSSSTLTITLQFNEINSNFPFTGEYNSVSNFDNQSIKSNGEVKLIITDFGIGGLGGGNAKVNEKIYIENDGTNITFIYCDVNVADKYTLNGKYTYML